MKFFYHLSTDFTYLESNHPPNDYPQSADNVPKEK